MSTHNICFHGEIKKILTRYSPLSGPMNINTFWRGKSALTGTMQ